MTGRPCNGEEEDTFNRWTTPDDDAIDADTEELWDDDLDADEAQREWEEER